MPLPLRRKPPITTPPGLFLHLLKNLGFISASLIFLPFSLTVLFWATLFNWVFPEEKRRLRAGERRLTVMVSGGRATKGLVHMRAFARAGHRVIAVEEPSQYLNAARFSKYVAAYHALTDPLKSQDTYTNRLVEIARREKVDVFVPASGVATTLCDGHAKPALEKLGVRVLQFDADLGYKLDKKDEFMGLCRDLGLEVPETVLVRSVEDVMNFAWEKKRAEGKRFLLKCVGVDDRTRNDMTLFPWGDLEGMRGYVKTLGITDENPYIIQEFVKGTEYCCQSVAIDGVVRTFSCCESSDLLMNYAHITPASGPSASNARHIAKQCLNFTTEFCKKMNITGQISFDFVERDGRVLPIECNPRTHTANTLLANHPGYAHAYLASPLANATYGSEGKARSNSNGNGNGHGKVLSARHLWPIQPSPAEPPTYWIPHEIFDAIRYLDPLTLVYRLMLEREAQWDWRDPVPGVWLYHVYWPSVLLGSLLSGQRWTRINASTGKVFWC
ncbi:hypothetical protein YB2330_001737 [Saitoella coloradoensis]